MYYRRTVSSNLLDALGTGVASFLPDLIRSQPSPRLLDLRLHGSPKPGVSESSATLYIGMRKVLEVVHDRSKGDALLIRGPGEAKPLEKYVSREGAVQAALSSRISGDLAVIDREAQFSFDDAAQRDATMEAVREPYREFLSRYADRGVAEDVPWYGTGRHGALGGEIDAVAIDSRGRLLVIEVKPGAETGTGRWAPVQVHVYADLFERWISKRGQAAAREDLHAMLAQRVELGLSPDHRLAEQIRVVPVAAFGAERQSPELMPQLAEVYRELVASGLGPSELEVWNVDQNGDVEVVSLP